MADTWNHKTIISPDDVLYIDGELVIRGNIVQVESTQIINKLESNTLIINSDGGQDDFLRYTVPELVLKYNGNGNDRGQGWGMMYYRADDTLNAEDPGVGYMRFSTVGYPVNGAIQIQKIHTMPFNSTDSSANIAILEGNAWSGTACAAYAMTSPITFNVLSDDNGGYTDIVPVSDTFTKAGDIVTFNLNLDQTGVTPGIYGANVSTTNRIDVDDKGRITSVVEQAIDITLDQITGGTFNTNVANVVYDLFSAGTGLTYNGSTTNPKGEFYITDTTVVAGSYGINNSVTAFDVNAQGQITSANQLLIDIVSNQISDFEIAVENLFNAVTISDGTGWSVSDLTYSNGVFYYTPPTQAEVRGTISAAAPINYDNVTGVIGLDNTISQDLTFEGLVDLSNATIPGFTIQGNVDILGNLNVVAKDDLYVRDANIVMNVGNAIQDSHIVIDRSSGVALTNSYIRWNSTANEWSHFDGTNEWVLVRDTSDIAEGSNLWFTQDRVNTNIDAYLVAGDGIEFIDVVAQGNPNAKGIFAKLSGNLIFNSNQEIDLGPTIVTTVDNFSMLGEYDFLNGVLQLPDGQQSIDRHIYTNIATNEAFIHMNGVNVPLTPTADFGRVDSGNGVVSSGAIEIYAGTQIVPIGPINSNVAIIRGLKAGANTSVYYDPDPASDGNVIIIDAEGLSQSEVLNSFSVTNVSGFGNITYDNSVGLFEYRGVTDTQIRSLFNGAGLINYDSATGEFTTGADNYLKWRLVTDDGAGSEHPVVSEDRVVFQSGGTGLTVTNSGNVVTITNTNATESINEVIAGNGLTGGGTSGTVTLDVGAGTGVTVDANSISIGQDVATTADVEFNSVTGDINTTSISAGSSGTSGTIEGQWSLTPGSTLEATYADLAEKYQSDKEYEPGTVVVVGGLYEVTACHSFMSKRVAGVVSANPAFIMNKDCKRSVAVALRGRVPVKVSGIVKKGDLLVTADELGCATAAQTDDVPPTAVVGIALKDSEMGWTEVKV